MTIPFKEEAHFSIMSIWMMYFLSGLLSYFQTRTNRTNISTDRAKNKLTN